MILLGLGSNLTGSWGAPSKTLDRAVAELAAAGVTTVARSRWLGSAPYGRTDQPAYVNGVIAVATHLPPRALLYRCHQVERLAGRERRVRWGARTLDIDILAYHGVVAGGGASSSAAAVAPGALFLPHPGIAQRPFVLAPIHEIAPFWHHPVTGETAFRMLSRLRGATAGAVLAPA